LKRHPVFLITLVVGVLALVSLVICFGLGLNGLMQGSSVWLIMGGSALILLIAIAILSVYGFSHVAKK
jgi:hypothetical protein